MNMRHTIPYLLIILLLASSCHQEELESPDLPQLYLYGESEQVEQVSLKAYIHECGSKSSLNDAGDYVNWSLGDMIGLMTAGGTVYCYTLQEGAGTPSGVFTGIPIEGEILGAWYPYVEGQTYDSKDAAGGAV